mgnify:CR=1 FL=1
MLDGEKKELLRKSYTEHLPVSKKKLEKPALEVFEEAMNNIMPVLEVKLDVSVEQHIRCLSTLDQIEDRH